MSFRVPQEQVDLEPWLDERGDVFAAIRGHDSGCTSYGVEIEGRRWFVKTAPHHQRWQLDGALMVHRRVRHDAIVPLVADFAVADGHAVVYPWVAGENLRDGLVPGSDVAALDRFRGLPDASSWAAYGELLAAHVAVARAGLVAVDLYSGSLVHDADASRLWIVDLDLYTPPYRLEIDRQFGSTRLMPPEELTRGSWVDQPATVFTLARLADHLGCVRTPGQAATVARATEPAPDDRYATVAAYADAWGTGRARPNG
ncbi:hypothetical protein BH09ACT12_BH09ACT12_30200 [soil metagenome]